MTDEQLLQRIVINPNVMAGKPVIKGTRLPVEFIIQSMAHGATEDDLLDDYEELIREDIFACLLYAARNINMTDVVPVAIEGV